MENSVDAPRAAGLRPPVKPLTSVLIKPAGADCNLHCTYCFYLEKAALYPETPRHRMSDEVLAATVRQVMRDGLDAVSFGWQGGEPTLMGLDFFRRAVRLQQRYGAPGQSVGNGLQTNGLLIDDAWAAFLKEYHFLVGLSLDGPREIHDRYRLTRGGEPTWERVRRAARLMLDAGVAVNALCVINAASAEFPDEIYDYLRSVGLDYMQWIPCVEPDPDRPGEVAPYSVSAERFGAFLCRTFDRWIRDFKDGRPTTSIRFFESVFHTYVEVPPPECTLCAECGVYVVIEHTGDVYACDFYVDPAWRLGNVLQGSLIEMLNSPRQHEFGRRKSALPAACRTCRWLKHCRGGCPKDRLRATPEPEANLNHLCRAYQMFFEHADGKMKSLAEKWLKEQRESQRHFF